MQKLLNSLGKFLRGTTWFAPALLARELASWLNDAPGAAGSGQRAAGSGQRAAGSGQRAAGSGQRAAGSGQRAAGSGQRAAR